MAIEFSPSSTRPPTLLHQRSIATEPLVVTVMLGMRLPGRIGCASSNNSRSSGKLSAPAAPMAETKTRITVATKFRKTVMPYSHLRRERDHAKCRANVSPSRSCGGKRDLPLMLSSTNRLFADGVGEPARVAHQPPIVAVAADQLHADGQTLDLDERQRQSRQAEQRPQRAEHRTAGRLEPHGCNAGRRRRDDRADLGK